MDKKDVLVVLMKQTCGHCHDAKQVVFAQLPVLQQIWSDVHVIWDEVKHPQWYAVRNHMGGGGVPAFLFVPQAIFDKYNNNNNNNDTDPIAKDDSNQIGIVLGCITDLVDLLQSVCRWMETPDMKLIVQDHPWTQLASLNTTLALPKKSSMEVRRKVLDRQQRMQWIQYITETSVYQSVLHRQRVTVQRLVQTALPSILHRQPEVYQLCWQYLWLNETPSLVLPPVLTAPKDVVGRSAWTVLHAIADHYPEIASDEKQETTRIFLQAFSDVYPCADTCGEHMLDYLTRFPPRLEGRSVFRQWTIDFHNYINVILNKPLWP